jgi:hypothetical protein
LHGLSVFGALIAGSIQIADIAARDKGVNAQRADS